MLDKSSDILLRTLLTDQKNIRNKKLFSKNNSFFLLCLTYSSFQNFNNINIEILCLGHSNNKKHIANIIYWKKFFFY